MLSVLGYEGPQLRAYLLMLKYCGITVNRLVLLAPYMDVASGKPVAGFLPRSMRAKLGLKLLGMRMNHWPNQIAMRHTQLFESITQTMTRAYNLPDGFYKNMLRPFNWRSVAQEVITLPFNGSLKDPALAEWVAGNMKGAVLYTGGGIMPAALLSIPGIRIIHVHPGYLPYVRGADGLLWSVLLRKKFGVSGFYMEKGIDTGDLLFAKEQEMLTFDRTSNDNKILYRAVFAFIDPVIRAQALCDLLKQHKDLSAMPATPQDTNIGETYHFMHEDLRNYALSRLFLRQ